jgi:hypothetical protein
MARGDHIYVDRGLYAHHGVDLGDGTVIELTAKDDRTRSSVRRVAVAEFASGSEVQVREYGRRLDPDETVARAYALLGTHSYDLVANNCEHLATWCVGGEHKSAQVGDVLSASAAIAVGRFAPAAGIELVASAGTGPARSGANLTSGLAAVGGTSLGGLVTLAAAGGTVGALAARGVLRDSQTLPEPERRARQIGRSAGVGGGVVGAGAAIALVGIMGVPGYSASGITSGLAAMGGQLGGGMVTGIRTAVGLPIAAAIIFALLFYWACKQRSVTTPVLPASRPG